MKKVKVCCLLFIRMCGRIKNRNYIFIKNVLFGIIILFFIKNYRNVYLVLLFFMYQPLFYKLH